MRRIRRRRDGTCGLSKRTKVYILRKDASGIGVYVRRTLDDYRTWKRNGEKDQARWNPMRRMDVGAREYHNERDGKNLIGKVVLMTPAQHSLLIEMKSRIIAEHPGVSLGDICGAARRRTAVFRSARRARPVNVCVRLTPQGIEYLNELSVRLTEILGRHISKSEAARLALKNFKRRHWRKRGSRIASVWQSYRECKKKTVCLLLPSMKTPGLSRETYWYLEKAPLESTKRMYEKARDWALKSMRPTHAMWMERPKRITSSLIIEAALFAYHPDEHRTPLRRQRSRSGIRNTEDRTNNYISLERSLESARPWLFPDET